MSRKISSGEVAAIVTPDPEYRITTGQQLTSACTGAMLTSLIVTPLDVVKVRLQSQAKTLLSNKCYLYCNGLMEHICPCSPDYVPDLKQPKHFTGTIDAISKIARFEGVTALWSGLSPTLILAVPSTVVYFVTYEKLRLLIKDRHKGVLPLWGPLIAGISARMWAATIVSPIELVRTKMQSKKLSYVEIFDAIKLQTRDRGALGLFRGLAPTLLRDVPFSGIYWMSYEGIKRNFTSGPPSLLVSFIGGAVSGSLAATVTTPFDVIKTHQQIELGEKEIYSGKRKYNRMTFARLFGFGTLVTDPPQRGSSMVATVRRIYQQSGVRGLFSGLTPRIARVAPSCAIMISSFEYGKKFFHRPVEIKTVM